MAGDRWGTVSVSLAGTIRTVPRGYPHPSTFSFEVRAGPLPKAFCQTQCLDIQTGVYALERQAVVVSITLGRADVSESVACNSG